MTDAATRLATVRAEIARAARHARRDAAEVALVAVSKRRSAEEIEALIAAGHSDFGESRVQEAHDKWAAIKARHPHIRLHMVGRLQSNKAMEAAGLFDVIHSLDRSSLLDALSATPQCPPCFVQVNVGNEEQKGGVPLGELEAFLAKARGSGVSLAGLMAIAPRDREPGPYFALLADLASRHRIEGLSMGMSADYATAVMLGATVVRVGTALFED